tara:strand:+ start:522 stop:1688 length:1167 start_codon:yes stop_codon:yes gene_type:complete
MSGYIINDFIFNIDENNISVKYDKFFTDEFIVNISLKEYLKNIKTEIDDVQGKWDIVKKVTNKYEYINSSVNIDNVKSSNNSVCCYKPISRSYFKMVEILNIFDFKFLRQDNIKTFHLAEGPGGFIEAIAKNRKSQNDIYYGMTLMDNDVDVPKWNKITNLLKEYNNIKLIYGPKNDGNLYFSHNIEYITKHFKHSMHFITGDGGFDYSVDFNKQEENSINLIFCEMLYALILQKAGGCFVLKVFDIFHRNTIEILSILSYFYEKVYVYKPLTSREANSEKYIICINFQIKKNYNVIINKLKHNFNMMKNKKIVKILDYEPNSYFLNKIQEINAIYGQQQIENILCTINHVHDFQKEKMNKIKQNNIEKCKKWCQEYNQPINTLFLNN